MPKKEASNVTRIKAGSNSSKSTSNKKAPAAKKPAASKATTNVAVKTAKVAEKKEVKKATAAKKRVVSSDEKRRNPLAAIGGYFKGAWYELRQVRWPDRKATWSMTGALLLFTAFFIVLILLLDLGFQYLFKLLIG
jgi:preprotein translocase subunit SecE